MNPSSTPINQYSLQSLESWLVGLGATKDIKNPSAWHLRISNWNATINFEESDLRVVWELDGNLLSNRLFSYSINREDVENAILQGP